VVTVNGKPVGYVGMFEEINGSEGRPVRLTVERGGRRIQLEPVRPFEDTDGRYRVGFRPDFEPVALHVAFGESLRLTGTITKEIGAVLGRLVRGSGREEISSPIGIVRGSSSALERGFETFFWVLGLISLSLALLNLLPLLPLDGGHIAFSIIEGIRGRSVGREVYERVSVVGIALVLTLFFIGLSNDIGGRTGG
jgi:regulator of sigma E protease